MIDMPDFTTEPEPKKAKKVNYGKIFEKDFKDSIPDNVFFYRFRDGTGAWEKSDITRFQSSNICDTMLFYQSKLYLLELKTVQGKSFSFANVRQNQIEQLLKASRFEGITAGFIINFRDIEKTVFISAFHMYDTMCSICKKSFNISDLENIKHIEIPSIKKRTRYRYDLEPLLK